ncbi:Phenoloxidase-activating factor 2 [Eumeta japonica]|uniref:Phenoloxidase-activating factor 2 n=1 Tax=Eumeta variegata TaxID=151549 RepID=A0A4C1V3I8_EUMVA|nr:Phenoloxidase-activating factor 2 [Eumeta japonica]
MVENGLHPVAFGRPARAARSLYEAAGLVDPDSDRNRGFQNRPNRYRQHGIVAWGIRCGEGGTPGVYADVASLRSWVDAAVLGRGYDPSVYTA